MPCLYSAVFDAAQEEGRAEVTCEVNLQPPNPRSLSFHERLGFREVGRQSTKGGAFTVILMAAPVQAPSSLGAVLDRRRARSAASDHSHGLVEQ